VSKITHIVKTQHFVDERRYFDVTFPRWRQEAYNSVRQGSVDGVQGLVKKRLLDFVHDPLKTDEELIKTQRFENWFCPRLQVIKMWGGGAPTQLRPLERANLNHWTT
jgi:hypothetical protein